MDLIGVEEDESVGESLCDLLIEVKSKQSKENTSAITIATQEMK